MEKIILVLFIKTLIVHFTYCQISIDPFTIAPTKAGWETRYLNRVDELDNGYTWNNHSSDTDDGKRYWSPLLADMKNAEGNSSTLQSLIDGRGHDGIFSSYAGSFYKPFSCPGYCMYYFKYKND